MPEMDAMFTMFPFEARKAGSANLVTKKAPLRLTSSMASQTCSSAEATGVGCHIPALLTSTSRPPRPDCAASTSLRQPSTEASPLRHGGLAESPADAFLATPVNRHSRAGFKKCLRYGKANPP